MVSYDTTQIALFVSLVLTVAAIGTLLVLGMVVETFLRSRRVRVTSPQPVACSTVGSRSTTEPDTRVTTATTF
jgi:hypothetical protein